jgi:hypothetical protein
MTTQEFKAHLKIEEMPKELNLLIEFQNNSDFENYSEGFGIYEDDLNHWSTAAEFQEKLKVLGQANGSGSQYAFWEDVKGKKLGEMPIVVFGDEGGIHVVAENLLQLMHLLTFDSEISVDHDEVYFYKDKDEHEGTEDGPKYSVWIKENFNLDPIEKPDDIIKKAQAKYKVEFDIWLKQFLD